ncbi:MAG: GNAT family N-acetyltransferase [Bacteroidales bacterium]|nr:GNAT family N-acetyltransferase [Bacteroidales bacterium]
MEEIIPPIAKDLMLNELTVDKFLRHTNYGHKEIYIITADDSPNLMKEIGRLRELSFREAHGGTGKALDIDRFDQGPNSFKQLLVWDPIEREIVGGYRFIDCNLLEKSPEGTVQTPTATLFAYSRQFVEDYLPKTIELGRSFVQPAYQPVKNIRKGMYSLDNLWDGLGALVINYPQIDYFFGKVTMYSDFDPVARDMILFFMDKYFPDKDKLVYPHQSLGYKTDVSAMNALFSGGSYLADFKLLVQQVRLRNENVPPLVNAYMGLSSTMRSFGTALNAGFGSVEETGILVTIGDIYDEKKDRHLKTYVPDQVPTSAQ